MPFMTGIRLLTGRNHTIKIRVVMSQLPMLFKFQHCEEDASKGTVQSPLSHRLAATRSRLLPADEFFTRSNHAKEFYKRKA